MPYKDPERLKEWLKNHKRKPIHPNICLNCQIEFLSIQKIKKYCSTECLSKARKKYLDIPDAFENSHKKIDKNLGYIRVYCPMHPKSNTWGYVYEHRLIMELKLGRYLYDNEIVHHKNGKRWDNRDENLEVMDKKEHSKLASVRWQRPEDRNI